jgi:hypothetical protein
MGRLLLGLLLASIGLLPHSVSAQVTFGAARLPPSHVDRRASRGDSDVAKPDRSAMRPNTPQDGRWAVTGPNDDLYRATPDTYAPRYDRPSNPYGGRRHVMQGFGDSPYPYVPFMAAYGYSQDRSSNSERQGYLRSQASNDFDTHSGDREKIEQPPKPYTPLTAAGAPKTFYVIPRCYAGDTPPRADELPAACDLNDVRVVPPVTSRSR